METRGVFKKNTFFSDFNIQIIPVSLLLKRIIHTPVNWPYLNSTSSLYNFPYQRAVGFSDMMCNIKTLFLEDTVHLKDFNIDTIISIIGYFMIQNYEISNL